MHRIRTWPPISGRLASVVAVMFFAGACSRDDAEVQDNVRELTATEIKLNQVLEKMVERCEDENDREALQAATLFRNLKGLDVPVVGFKVPINSGANHLFLSFTLGHFEKTPVDVLAAQGLEDLQRAKADREEESRDDK